MKINRIYIALLLLVSIVVVYIMVTRFNAPRVGYVRNKVLVEKFDGMKESQLLYNKKLSEWQHNVDTVGIILEKDVQIFEKEKTQMPSAMRVFREHQLQERLQAFENFKLSMEQKAKEEEERLAQSAYNQINAMVEGFAQEHGYDLILGTTSDGNIMYGNKTMDITEEVLIELNKKFNGK